MCFFDPALAADQYSSFCSVHHNRHVQGPHRGNEGDIFLIWAELHRLKRFEPIADQEGEISGNLEVLVDGVSSERLCYGHISGGKWRVGWWVE